MSTKGTTVRKVRLDDDVWEPARAKAEAEGTDRSTVVRVLLEGFLAAPARDWPQGGPGKAKPREDGQG